MKRVEFYRDEAFDEVDRLLEMKPNEFLTPPVPSHLLPAAHLDNSA